MKVRKQIKKFTATFLTLALLLTMLPTIALAEDQELIKFKNMQMDVLRNNAPVSLYDYASKENDFIRGLAFNLDQTWVKLNYVISYSQYVKLELYRMEDGTSEDGQNWNEDNPLFLESKITDNPDDGYGANLKEPFLGEYLGYLNGVRINDNIAEPYDEAVNMDWVTYQDISPETLAQAKADAVWGSAERITMDGGSDSYGKQNKVLTPI